MVLSPPSITAPIQKFPSILYFVSYLEILLAFVRLCGKNKDKNKTINEEEMFSESKFEQLCLSKIPGSALPIWQLFTQVGWLAEDIYMYRATKQ